MADAAETMIGVPRLGGEVCPAKINAVGLKWGLYSVTKVTKSDWVIFGDFTTVYFASACCYGANNASAESCNIDTTTTNYVQLGGAATGVEYILVIGV